MVTLKKTKGLFTGNNYCPYPSGWAIMPKKACAKHFPTALFMCAVR